MTSTIAFGALSTFESFMAIQNSDYESLKQILVLFEWILNYSTNLSQPKLEWSFWFSLCSKTLIFSLFSFHQQYFERSFDSASRMRLRTRVAPFLSWNEPSLRGQLFGATSTTLDLSQSEVRKLAMKVAPTFIRGIRGVLGQQFCDYDTCHFVTISSS